MIVAYLRVSTNRQHLENQRDEIERFALRRGIVIDRIYNDIVSGKKSSKERKLGDILKRLKSGDTLIVTEISRLSRTLIDVMNIIHQCIEREITLHSTKEGYTFENNQNSKILGFAFGLVAEIERNLISARTKEALALRKANGMILGRPVGSAPKRKILVENHDRLMEMLGQGISYKRIGRKLGVSVCTIDRYLRFLREQESV
ncbi:recombinase family protein [Alistipes sp. OttesenSCG-928-L06]|nr:recombinase family protein [Alistipes sp. OttesenSCG-928-L06]